MNEMIAIQSMMQMLGGGVQVWISVVWLLCLVGAMLFQPQAIRNCTLFRWACTLFALSVLLPSCLQVGLFYFQSITGGGMGGSFRGSSQSPMLQLLSIAAGPLLLGLSLFAGFAAIMPRKEGATQPKEPPKPPEKHPLD